MRRPLGARLLIVSVTAGLAVSGFFGSQVAVGAATNIPIDHFVCYPLTSGGTGFQLPPSVRLTNKFTSPGGMTASVKGINLHCAPAQQRASSANAGVTNPNAHLACWAIAPSAPQPAKTLHISNQFGTGDVVMAQPVRLCVPSWNKGSGRPKQPVASPSGLSHYTCYSVSYAPGSPAFHAPTPLLIDDSVLGKTKALKVFVPKIVCIASVTTYTKAGKTATYPIKNTAAHLLCFTVTGAAANKRTYDQNQFGDAKVFAGAASFLCEKSSSMTVVPATTTTDTTLATTTTEEPTTTTTEPPTTTTEETTTTAP